MKIIFIKFLKYLPWAFIQQIFVITLFIFFFSHITVFGAIFSAVSIFSFLHFPNKFLMFLTFFIEIIFLYFYTSVFSLLWITGVHALIAVLVKIYVPSDITHGMRVLWNYYKN
jgi:hypothetical protein